MRGAYYLNYYNSEFTLRQRTIVPSKLPPRAILLTQLLRPLLLPLLATTPPHPSCPVHPRPHRPTSPSPSSLHLSLASAPQPVPPRPLPPLAVSPSVPHILHARARRRASLAHRAGHNPPCVRSALPSPSPSRRHSPPPWRPSLSLLRRSSLPAPPLPPHRI